MFENATKSPGHLSMTDHSLEIIIMLLVMFILGYLLRLFIDRSRKDRLGFEEKPLLKVQHDLNLANQRITVLEGINNENNAKNHNLQFGSSIDFNAELEAKNKEIDHLKAQLDAAVNYRSRQVDFSQTANDEIEELKALIESKDSEIESLKMSMAKKDTDSDNLETSNDLENIIINLKAVIEAQDQEIDEYKTKLASFDRGLQTESKAVKADDLKKIEGIGPKIQELLNNENIYTFKDLSETTVEKLESILEAAGPRYRMHTPKTWPKQAEMAHNGEWEALEKWQDELDGGK